jgi:hypothetical protein
MASLRYERFTAYTQNCGNGISILNLEYGGLSPRKPENRENRDENRGRFI